jgi:hypothetical protein
VKASNTDVDDLFGVTVGLDGDTLAIGAYAEDSAALGVNGDQSDNSSGANGAVYVYVRTGSTWTQQAYLKSSNGDMYNGFGDEFGYALAVSGDTIAVGAWLEDSSATGINGNQADNGAEDSGAVYVFKRTGTDWAQQAYIKASNPNASDLFGFWIALSDDTLVVAAYAEDSNARGIGGDQNDNSMIDAGAAYVFTRARGQWSQLAYLKASNTDGNDRFSYAHALTADTLLVGAFAEQSNATGVGGDQADNSLGASGAGYVFR